MDNHTKEKNIPAKLRSLRRSRGLTVHQLAEEIGENYQKVSRIERGKTHLSIDYLMKVTKTLETPLDTILVDKQPIQESSADYISKSSLLSRILIAVEERSLANHSPHKKAALVSKIYETALQCPDSYLDQFLSAIFDTLSVATSQEP